ncbi:CDKN2AIP N-terminal-like protein [Platysternon megacephalum]|uniref:CDKN2AIP N-terminal-like protein n=1 Tax=Platysternon megacephalum TaxID=55544 RepID=A0A4D9EWL3_9SAUR|nr:CDKN2AIP N-terminal-like protein [Platysternon megacephalum]
MKDPTGGAWEEEEDGGVSTARWGELPKREGGAKTGLESPSSSLEAAWYVRLSVSDSLPLPPTTAGQSFTSAALESWVPSYGCRTEVLSSLPDKRQKLV